MGRVNTAFGRWKLRHAPALMEFGLGSLEDLSLQEFNDCAPSLRSSRIRPLMGLRHRPISSFILGTKETLHAPCYSRNPQSAWCRRQTGPEIHLPPGREGLLCWQPAQSSQTGPHRTAPPAGCSSFPGRVHCPASNADHIIISSCYCHGMCHIT